jgi:hypothetical protein
VHVLTAIFQGFSHHHRLRRIKPRFPRLRGAQHSGGQGFARIARGKRLHSAERVAGRGMQPPRRHTPLNPSIPVLRGQNGLHLQEPSQDGQIRDLSVRHTKLRRRHKRLRQTPQTGPVHMAAKAIGDETDLARSVRRPLQKIY